MLCVPAAVGVGPSVSSWPNQPTKRQEGDIINELSLRRLIRAIGVAHCQAVHVGYINAASWSVNSFADRVLVGAPAIVLHVITSKHSQFSRGHC